MTLMVDILQSYFPDYFSENLLLHTIPAEWPKGHITSSVAYAHHPKTFLDHR